MVLSSIEKFSDPGKEIVRNSWFSPWVLIDLHEQALRRQGSIARVINEKEIVIFGG